MGENEMSDVTTLKDLEAFLGSKFPEGAFHKIDQIELLENSRIRAILPESDPQLYINKAIFITNDQSEAVAATTHVSSEMCRGHFDWYPMMPLALMAQCAGQAGAILVNLVAGSKKGVPLAIHVRDTRSVSDKTKNQKKDFIVPGDDLLFFALYKGGKLGLHRVTVQVYTDGSIIGALEEINYILVNKGYFNHQKAGDD